MSHPRLYPRVRPSGQMSSEAKIFVTGKSSAITCKVIDYSRGGACLELFPMVALPERFELVHSNVRKQCRVVWRRGVRIGVAF